MLTGGEAVVRGLLAHDVDTLFGLPGIQNDWLYNALFDAGDAIRVVHSRHEQGAAYMALGYAQAGGGVGVCSVVPGPGFLNASAALATAYGLNAKVLLLVGQIPSTSIGRGLGILHEIPDQLSMLRSLTKWAERVVDPSEAATRVAEAFWQLHSGRPRPVGLEIPMDVLERRTAVVPGPPILPHHAPPVDGGAVEDAAKLLGQAEAPMIFVGGGAQGVGVEVTELAEALQAPVVGYRTGRGVVDSRHYLSLYQPPARRYWQRSDVVLAVGTTMRVPLQRWVRDQRPRLVRIDVDPASHQLLTLPDIAITARAEEALPVLLGALERYNRTRPSREEELLKLRAWWAREVAELEPQLSFLKVIREELGEDGIFVDELTQIGYASRIAFPVYRPKTFISTGYLGTLGYGFPTAIGVKLARPDVPVVSVAGDGGLLFGVQELATAVQQGVPVVTILFNDNRYGNVQMMQKSLYENRVIATDLHNPDFVELAAAFGALGIRAEAPADLRQALRRGLSADGPTLIEVPVGEMPSIDRFR